MPNIYTERNKLVIGKLSAAFPGSFALGDESSDIAVIHVDKQKLVGILMFLRDENDLQYNFLTTLCGMHYDDKNKLGVVYHLHSFSNNHRLRIKTETEITEPEIDSITSLWPSANWMERETFDFFGIQFTGHPNLTRILNVDDMQGFPLRKDFPLEDQTREDKDDSMFGR